MDIKQLKSRHKELDEIIELSFKNYVPDLKIRKFKKEKLRIKEQLEKNQFQITAKMFKIKIKSFTNQFNHTISGKYLIYISFSQLKLIKIENLFYKLSLFCKEKYEEN